MTMTIVPDLQMDNGYNAAFVRSCGEIYLVTVHGCWLEKWKWGDYKRSEKVFKTDLKDILSEQQKEELEEQWI